MTEQQVPACPQCHQKDQVQRGGTISVGKYKPEIRTLWICKKCKREFW